MITTGVLGTGFEYLVDVVKDGHVEQSGREHNLMPQTSVDFIASLIRGSGASPYSNWYVGVFEGDYLPGSDTKPSDLNGAVAESVAYDESARPAWTHSYDNSSVISNAASRAEFTFNATKKIYGAFLISASIKGGTGGQLLSIARFSSPRDVEAGSVLRVTAGIVLTPTGIQ